MTVEVRYGADRPGKVGVLTAKYGSPTSVSLNWSAPTNTGPAITSYDVHLRVAGASTPWTTKNTTFSAGANVAITGLQSQTKFEFQVRAKNADGDGDWSDLVYGKTITPTGQNEIPVIRTDSIGTYSIAESATGNLGSPIVATEHDASDTVTWSLTGTGSDSFSITGGQLSVITGLYYEDRDTYSLTVTVSDGQDSDSEDVTVMVTDVPDLLGSLSAPLLKLAGGVTLIDVWWLVPDNLAPQIINYHLWFRDANAPEGTDWTKWTLVGGPGYPESIRINYRAADTDYNFRLRAVTAGGFSRWAEGSVTTRAITHTLVIDPASITGLSIDENATGQVGTITVTSTGSAAIDEWSSGGPDGLSFRLYPQWDDSEARLYVAKAFDYEASATKTRTVTVSAGDGTLKASATITVAVNDLKEPPSAPTGLTLDSATTDSLTLSWNEPAANTGPPITGYSVCAQWQGFGVCKETTSTTFTYGGLPPNTEIDVRVQAKNDDGWGDYSEVSKFSTDEVVYEPPSAPTGLTLDSATTDSLTLSWNEPDNTGPPIIGYIVCVRWQGFWVCQGTTSTTFTYGSLPGNTKIDVRVQAKNDDGAGAWSEISEFSTQ